MQFLSNESGLKINHAFHTVPNGGGHETILHWGGGRERESYSNQQAPMIPGAVNFSVFVAFQKQSAAAIAYKLAWKKEAEGLRGGDDPFLSLAVPEQLILDSQRLAPIYSSMRNRGTNRSDNCRFTSNT